jgi:hypothetical protein
MQRVAHDVELAISPLPLIIAVQARAGTYRDEARGGGHRHDWLLATSTIRGPGRTAEVFFQ